MLSALCLLALTACGPGSQHPGLVLEPVPATPAPTAPTPATTPTGTAPDPETCFDVAGAYTAVTLVPLSTEESDPDFRPEETAASVHELAAGMPAELRPAFDDAVAALRAAGDAVQPAELAGLHRTLAPVDAWLQHHCAASAPAR